MARPVTDAEFGEDNPNTVLKNDTEAKQAWNPLEILKAGDLNGFIAWVSRYATSASNEIANAVIEFRETPNEQTSNQLATVLSGLNTRLTSAEQTLPLKQDVSNMVQTVSGETDKYPSAKAVQDAVAGFQPALYELVANKKQDLTSPSATTYPSTQAVANESSRIVSIMDNLQEQVDNLDAEIKKKIGYVDYSVVTEIANIPNNITTFTAPSGGIITYSGIVNTNNNTKEIKVNNSVNLDGASCSAAYMGGNAPGKIIPLKKGDVVTFNVNVINVRFFAYEEN